MQNLAMSEILQISEDGSSWLDHTAEKLERFWMSVPKGQALVRIGCWNLTPAIDDGRVLLVRIKREDGSLIPLMPLRAESKSYVMGGRTVTLLDGRNQTQI